MSTVALIRHDRFAIRQTVEIKLDGQGHMPQPVHVPIDWSPSDTWKGTTLPALIAKGANPKLIKRCVYVIRLDGNFCVRYPKGESPVVYVGEGKFGGRITSHRKWAAELEELVQKSSFQVCVASPRVRNNEDAYRDCEAALLQRFAKKFHSAPLWNKQFEKRRFLHYQYSQRQLDYALCKRSGAKYKWAIQPMRASMFYGTYGRTHV